MHAGELGTIAQIDRPPLRITVWNALGGYVIDPVCTNGVGFSLDEALTQVRQKDILTICDMQRLEGKAMRKVFRNGLMTGYHQMKQRRKLVCYI
jgi:hypothetical protein